MSLNSFPMTIILLMKLAYFDLRAVVFDGHGKKRFRGALSKKIDIESLKSILERLEKKTKTSIPTKREAEVIDLILKEKRFREISKTLNIALKTVYLHRKNALFKIGLLR
ncbi:helix-turn-helix domain-containing protein [Serratia ureilytica]|uniref:LuxR C-terminal-related transcriptional regulator n=1 Tax=Serratia ureilytica TaxID=300181 RepID=UPI0011CC1399|nr:LuxR C-terminal-related transcriptional regulator [Serratia ureilytica]TXE51167.1 helix-turn-helix domain-containing protein [Serratia ureilytica]